MSPDHHPDEDTLLAFGMGAIPPGAALIVHVHLSFCAHCRANLRLLDQLGGVLLEETSPAPLSLEALPRALAAIAAAAPDLASPAIVDTPAQAIAGLRHGPWRPFTPGLEVADVEGNFDAHETVCLLKCEPGSAVPRHGHEMVERFIVLEGRFGVDETVYGPGDFIEADDNEVHTPFIPADGDCLCLFALEGGLVFVDPTTTSPAC